MGGGRGRGGGSGLGGATRAVEQGGALCKEMHEAYLRTLAAEEATVDDGAGLLRMCQFILMVAKQPLQPYPLPPTPYPLPVPVPVPVPVPLTSQPSTVQLSLRSAPITTIMQASLMRPWVALGGVRWR